MSDRDALGNLLSKSSVGSYSYPASGPGSVRPHAATAAGSNSYSYDANGNMTTRVENGVTYQQAWDIENRLSSVTCTGCQLTGVLVRSQKHTTLASLFSWSRHATMVVWDQWMGGENE